MGRHNYNKWMVMALSWAVGLAVAGLPVARAGIIYQDNFNHNGDLNGSAPAPINSEGSTWTSVAGEFTTSTTNGGEAIVSSAPGANISNNGSAYLPISLTGNTTYTLTATLAPDTSGNWLALGFGGTSTGNANSGSTMAWLLYDYNGLNQSGSIQTFYGGGTDNGHGYTPPSGDQPDTFTVSVNAATGQVDFTDSLGVITGQSFPSALSSTQISSISSVLIGQNTGGGTFQNFELSTSTVPEPGTGAMLLAGLAAVLFLSKVPRRLGRQPAQTMPQP